MGHAAPDSAGAVVLNPQPQPQPQQLPASNGVHAHHYLAAPPPALGAPPPANRAHAGAPATAAPAGHPWVLAGEPFPPRPTGDLLGPFVRYNDHDPLTGHYAVSVLAIASPSLAPHTVQLHWALNAPAMTAAPGQVLDEFMGYRAYRFDILLQLQEAPAVVNYVVGLVGGQAPLTSNTFHLPARGQSWRWIAYSCNGFHEAEPAAQYGGIGNLWRDVQQKHGQQPFHLQVAGGDQIYADAVLELPSLKPWLAIDDPAVRAREPFTGHMLQEVEQYYWGHYCRHFSDPAFGPALASIPYHYSWDDHDIFDGYGSYPDHLQQSAVFQGMFAVARRFYLLFQHHCRYDNAAAISKTMGHLSSHTVRSVGPDVVLLCPDTRSERSITQVCPPAAWDMLLADVTRRVEASQGAVRHLVVLLPVPIVYPKIPASEALLAAVSKGMASMKPVREWVTKLNLPSGALSVFQEPDLLDDLLDHWTSADHVAEREALVRRLQVLAEQHSVRVTFLSGDVHVGAFGCFQAHPKQHIRVVDPKFMLQVVTSAIGNAPPPAAVVTALEATSMATTALGDTLDKMIKAFPQRHKLKGARNYCVVEPLHGTRTCDLTGALQPAGGLAFTLRIEAGPPGQPTGIETATQVAPVLLAGPRASSAGPYVTYAKAEASALTEGVKSLGHKFATFLARV